MKTAGRGNQTCYEILRSEPSTWSGGPENLLLNFMGWNTRKYPAIGKVFLLTFPFTELIRTYPAFDAGAGPRIPSEGTTIHPECGVYSVAAWGPKCTFQKGGKLSCDDFA
jgi:hypothetical protein